MSQANNSLKKISDIHGITGQYKTNLDKIEQWAGWYESQPHDIPKQILSKDINELTAYVKTFNNSKADLLDDLSKLVTKIETYSANGAITKDSKCVNDLKAAIEAAKKVLIEPLDVEAQKQGEAQNQGAGQEIVIPASQSKPLSKVLTITELQAQVKFYQGNLNQAKSERIITTVGRKASEIAKANNIKQATKDLEEANTKLRDEREKTPEGKIENRKQELENRKQELEELQKQNRRLARNIFAKRWNKKEIESNRLAIGNLEDQIYGGTEINAREKQEITQQKNWNNVLAKNSTRNNPGHQH